MEQPTPEQKADIDKRMEAFRTAYAALLAEHQVDLVAVPQLIPLENGAFGVTTQSLLMDKKFLPTPSPFQKKGKIISE